MSGARLRVEVLTKVWILNGPNGVHPTSYGRMGDLTVLADTLKQAKFDTDPMVEKMIRGAVEKTIGQVRRHVARGFLECCPFAVSGGDTPKADAE